MKVKDINLRYITDNKGRKRSVVLPLKQYRELIEDLEDLAAIADRRDEETISHEELKKELNQNGII